MSGKNPRSASRVLPPAGVPGLLRRRALTLASTAAALSLGGCGMLGDLGSHPEKPLVLETDSRPVVLVKQQDVYKQASEYASNVESAQKSETTTALSETHKPTPVILANSGSSPTPGETAVIGSITIETTKTYEIPKPTAAIPTAATLMPVTPAPLPAAPLPAAPTSSSVNGATPVPSATISPIAIPKDPAVPTAMTSAVAMASPPITTANLVAPTAIDAPAEPTVAQALDILRKQVVAKPTLANALALSLLDSSAAKSADTNPGKDLSPADQKLLADLLTALQTMPTAATSATVADRAAPLVAAAKKWEADADISLPKLVLASRVDSYGVYTPIDAKFEGGQRHTVIIYCEVANFASKKSDDGWFQTRLSQQETLITEDGLLVWRPNAEEVEDRSMNQRRDFYLVKKLTIPENLAVGKYTLRMSVTDKNTNKIAMVAIPIEVTAK